MKDAQQPATHKDGVGPSEAAHTMPRKPVPAPDVHHAPPRTRGRYACILLRGLSHDVASLAAGLRLDEDQLTLMSDGTLRAVLDLPPGEWLCWPDRGAALWCGHRPSALPSLAPQPIDVATAVVRLLRAGLWCRELAVLTATGWGPVQIPELAFRALARAGEILGVSGIWSDDTGSAGRLEILEGGLLYADDTEQAVRWLTHLIDSCD